MNVELYLRIPEERLEELKPALERAGAIPDLDIAAVEWENPRNRMSVYQAATGDRLDAMAQGFNRMLEQQGNSRRLRNPENLDTAARYRMLRFLNGNALWDQDGELSESWLEHDPAETGRRLEAMPELSETY